MNLFDAHIPMLTLTAKGDAVDCNSEFVRVFGYKRPNILQQDSALNFTQKLKVSSSEPQLLACYQLGQFLQAAEQLAEGIFCQGSMLHVYHYQVSFKLHLAKSARHPGCYDLRFFEINNKGVDPVTGLPNGWAISSQYQHDITSANKDNIHMAYLIFSVDNFASVNFHYGYQVGDTYLRKIGELIQHLIGELGFVVRYHNARFGILLREESQQPREQFEAKVHALVNELMSLFNRPVKLDGDIAILNPYSLGVTLNWRDFDSFFEMDAATEKAYFLAKAQGDSAMNFANQEYARERILQKSITNLLPKAIDNLEIDIRFQPQFSLPDKQLIGFEVLARWHIALTGYISPLDFVSTADHLGLNAELDMCILNKACRQLSKWQTQGYQVPKIAVNMSAKTLESAEVVEKVARIVEQSQCQAGQIEIEITETDKVADSATLVNNLQALKQRGFGFSMDDFGTGYSSLSLLRTFDFALDKIKLDIELTEKVCQQDKDKSFIKQIIELGKTLNIQVLAEGVESQAQSEALVDMGCDFAQGFLFSKPLTARDAVSFMGYSQS